MGGGASLDNGLSNHSISGRYYCHVCHHIFSGSEVGTNECSNCHSTFIEQLAEIRPRNIVNEQLTIDQSRRIANATALLRLLELQLRQELEQLQLALEAANARAGSDSTRKFLSPIMKAKLKSLPVSTDIYCSQPSCPICNEEFALEEGVLCMPCSHVFHNKCVMPWLDMKQNCPICRFQLDNTIPSLEELELESVEGLLEKLQWAELKVDVDDGTRNKSR